jgi:hypothetical protein
MKSFPLGSEGRSRSHQRRKDRKLEKATLSLLYFVAEENKAQCASQKLEGKSGESWRKKRNPINLIKIQWCRGP